MGAAGRRGVAKDRAARPSAVFRSAGVGEKTVNVTEDVELWYSGGAANHGWMLGVEDAEGFVRSAAPVWSGPDWKLRITYEPE